MRTLFLLATLLSPRLGVADPAQTRCYEGTETATVGSQTKVSRTVAQRTLDPSASEIRQHGWSEKAPDKEVVVVYRVNTKDNTFDFDHAELGAHGTGKLEGKPWQWTGYTISVTTAQLAMSGHATLAAGKISIATEVRRAGKVIATMVGEATSFDCAKLTDRRAALSR